MPLHPYAPTTFPICKASPFLLPRWDVKRRIHFLKREPLFSMYSTNKPTTNVGPEYIKKEMLRTSESVIIKKEVNETMDPVISHKAPILGNTKQHTVAGRIDNGPASNTNQAKVGS